MDHGDEIEACVLSFNKAFGKVNHKKLLYKLTLYGVSYQFMARIDVEESSETSAYSGALQGFGIGLSTVIFYINDFLDNLMSFIHLFADVTYITTQKISRSWNSGSIYGTWSFTPLSSSTLSSHRGDTQLIQASIYMALWFQKTNYIKYLGVTLDPKLE